MAKHVASMPTYEVRLSDILRISNKFTECGCNNCKLVADELKGILSGPSMFQLPRPWTLRQGLRQPLKKENIMYLDMLTVYGIMIALAFSIGLITLTSIANAKLQERNRYLRNVVKDYQRG